MAHYAFLDNNNIVTEVIVGINENELIEGKSPEQWYEKFRGQLCRRTSYNTIGGIHKFSGIPFRKNYAGVGYTYNAEWDAFIPPKPYPSWKLDYNTCLWIPPIPEPQPEEGYFWRWGEENQEWIKVELPTE